MAYKEYFSKVKNKTFLILKKGSNEIFNLWETRTFIFNLLFAVIPITLYYLGYLENIRENTGSIVTYVTGLLTLNTVFLTLLVTLKTSPIFERLKKHFPVLHDHLYYGLKRQIRSCIFFMLINLVIAMVGPILNLWVVAAGLIVWSYYLVDVSFGAIYGLKVVTELAVKDVDAKKPML